jgi:hypothetical protein
LEVEKLAEQTVNGVKMKGVRLEVPKGEGKKAVEKLAADHSDLHGLMVHEALYADVDEALRELNRRDIWVVSWGLYEHYLDSLLSDGWPLWHTWATFPYPTRSVGMVDAMAKWFLGHDLSRWIVDPGVSIGPSNIEEGWRAAFAGTWDADPPWLKVWPSVDKSSMNG